MSGGPWLGGSVGWSVVPVSQGCRFDPQSGHRQGSKQGVPEWVEQQPNQYTIFLKMSVVNLFSCNLRRAPSLI